MKVIVFDFDGTLTKNRKGSNCWYEIWKYIDELQNGIYGEVLKGALIIEDGKIVDTEINKYQGRPSLKS